MKCYIDANPDFGWLRQDKYSAAYFNKNYDGKYCKFWLWILKFKKVYPLDCRRFSEQQNLWLFTFCEIHILNTKVKPLLLIFVQDIIFLIYMQIRFMRTVCEINSLVLILLRNATLSVWSPYLRVHFSW